MDNRNDREYPVDRWAPGVWKNEPHREEWTDERTGLACLIVRNDMGALCGYVGVPEGHPAYRQHCSAEMLCGIEVHGGLTYANACRGAICCTPKPGEPDNVWWLGFDCAHASDFVPGLGYGINTGGEERPIGYVRTQVGVLAQQLGALAALPPQQEGRG